MPLVSDPSPAAFRALLDQLRAHSSDTRPPIVGVDRTVSLTALLTPRDLTIHGARSWQLEDAADVGEVPRTRWCDTRHPRAVAQCSQCSRYLLRSAVARHLELCGQQLRIPSLSTSSDDALLDADLAASMAVSGTASNDEAYGMDMDVSSRARGTKRKRDPNSSQQLGAHISKKSNARQELLEPDHTQPGARRRLSLSAGGAATAKGSEPSVVDEDDLDVSALGTSALSGMFGNQAAVALPSTDPIVAGTLNIGEEELSLLLASAHATADADGLMDPELLTSNSMNPSDLLISNKKKKKSAAKKANTTTGSRLKPGPVDLDRQCGVVSDPTKPPCARSLTCKTHSMSAKRAVLGRSRAYDLLLQDWQKAAQAQRAALQQRQKHTAHSGDPVTITHAPGHHRSTAASSDGVSMLARHVLTGDGAVITATTNKHGSISSTTTGGAHLLLSSDTATQSTVRQPAVDSDEEVDTVLLAARKIIAHPQPLIGMAGADGIGDPRRSWAMTARRRKCWKVREVLLEALKGSGSGASHVDALGAWAG